MPKSGAMGFEPTTSSLGSREHRTEGAESQALTNAPTNACTNACTDLAEIEHGGPAGATAATAGDATAAADAGCPPVRVAKGAAR